MFFHRETTSVPGLLLAVEASVEDLTTELRLCLHALEERASDSDRSESVVLLFSVDDKA
jgi:hypothetical protein